MTRVCIQYIGKRLISKDGKVANAFLYGKKEIYFKGKMLVRIGQWYWAEKQAKRIRLKNYNPKTATGTESSQKQIQKWEEQECIALGTRAEFLELKKFRSHTALIDLFYEKMKDLTGSESRAFARFVCCEIERKKCRQFKI